MGCPLSGNPRSQVRLRRLAALAAHLELLPQVPAHLVASRGLRLASRLCPVRLSLDSVSLSLSLSLLLLALVIAPQGAPLHRF